MNRSWLTGLASVFVVAAALILFLTLLLGVHQINVWVSQL